MGSGVSRTSASSTVPHRLSPHFHLSEFTDAEVVPLEVRDSLASLCHEVLERVRSYYNAPVRVTSGYRPKSKTDQGRTSQHARGEAADIKVKGRESWEIFHQALRDKHLPVDQCIVYVHSSHLHVSFTERRQPRRQFLVCTGPRTYVPWEEYVNERG